MLTEHGHQAVPANNVQAIAEAVKKILDDFMQKEHNGNRPAISEKNSGSLPTVADAVQKLIELAEGKTATCC
jgi:hypothetical protein